MSTADASFVSPYLIAFTLGTTLPVLFYSLYRAKEAWKSHTRALTWVGVLTGLNLYVGGLGNIIQGVMHSETQSSVYRGRSSQDEHHRSTMTQLREMKTEVAELLTSIQSRLENLDPNA
jgi:hypothetical protein